jgi:hypothetical protein
MRRAIFGALGVLALLTGCRSTGAPVGVGEHLSYPGFETFPTPRTFDGPGLVFRVDNTGKKFSVTQLPVRVEPVGEEEFPKLSQKSNWSAGLVANFLSIVLNLDASSKYTLEVSLGRGSRERTFDDAVDEALKEADIRFRRDNRYYIIRETIATPSVSLRLLDNDEASAKLKAEIDKKVSGDVEVDWRWGSEEKVTLVSDFAQPHRIFFLVDELLPPGHPVVGEGTIRRLPVAPGDVRWDSEEVR